MRTATIFPDKVHINSEDEVFAGYLDGTDWTKGEDKRLSRAHRQPNRIYATGGCPVPSARPKPRADIG